MAIRKGNKHQLGLFFLLEACQRNAAGWSTAVWPANAKLPLPHRRSSITRPCCSIERSSAKLLVFTCTSKFELSTGSESERVDALGLRAVEVIICMITRDFSVISMWRHRRLSLSLYVSQKSLTHNIGSASALPIMYSQTRASSLLLFSNFGHPLPTLKGKNWAGQGVHLYWKLSFFFFRTRQATFLTIRKDAKDANQDWKIQINNYKEKEKEKKGKHTYTAKKPRRRIEQNKEHMTKKNILSWVTIW